MLYQSVNETKEAVLFLFFTGVNHDLQTHVGGAVLPTSMQAWNFKDNYSRCSCPLMERHIELRKRTDSQ